MLGYLNAPSPFDQDGWLNTGDLVEQRGDYLRILGRTSDLINVGGQKVYPAEVQSVLLQLDNVRDAIVFGDPNPIMGQVVAARVNLVEPEDPRQFRARLRAFLGGRLERYKIPVRIELVEHEQFNARYKRIARPPGLPG
jgi:acyl-CoA synthetase (AMP-forming)/AMP-acid ligase II